MASDVEGSFQAAVNVVRSMPKKGSFQPSYDMMLKFYGLYKQATLGECKDSKPGFWDVVGKAKWDAWSTLGSMPKQDAMEQYVTELKQVIATMPQTSEVAEFTQVLKSFYETAYNESQEHIPAVYEVFRKKEIPSKDHLIINVNGLDSTVKSSLKKKHSSSQGRPKENGHVVNDKIINGDITHNQMNGRKEIILENGSSLDHHKPVFISDLDEDRREGVCQVNGSISNGEETKKVTFEENTPVQLLDTIKSQNGKPDAGVQDSGLNRGHSSPSCTSEDSDEEFCDSLDPEHMTKSNMELAEGMILSSVVASSQDGSLSNSSTATSTFTESDVSENDIGNSHHLTSTPHVPKKALHVKFDLENDKAVYSKNGHFNCEPVVISTMTSEAFSSQPFTVCETKGEASSVLPDENLNDHLTDRSSAGILKPYAAGSGYGGGDAASVQPSGRHIGGSRRQHQHGKASGKNGRGVVTSQVGRSYRRHSDSDSDDDDHPTGDDYDSTGTERDDSSERILLALERLQQDMNSVLRRLGSVEQAVVQRKESKKPWWMRYLPSKTVVFCVVWPVLVNLAFRYFRRRKEEREILEKARFLQIHNR